MGIGDEAEDGWDQDEDGEGLSFLQGRATSGLGDLCAVENHAAAIVGGQLFISGGIYSTSAGNQLAELDTLFALNLSQTIPADANISASSLSTSAYPNGLASQAATNLTILSDNTTLFFYYPGSSDQNQMWTYHVPNATWNQEPVSGDENNPAIAAVGGAISNPATGISYFTGSATNALQKRNGRKAPWLQMFNSSAPQEQGLKWEIGAGGGPEFDSADLVYVRAGKKGVLVGFAGVDPTDHSEFASSTLGTYRDMDTVFVFDIDSSTWYNITTTGDIPAPVVQACAGVSSAPDDSSFQITFYGGFSLFDDSPTANVTVLTIPAFQWINVTPNGINNTESGRWGHSCAMWNDVEMLVIGGSIGQGDLNTQGCDKTRPPFRVLDTTTFKWQTEFQPSITYSQPKAVYDVIGGDARGLSKVTAPENGWPHSARSALSSIFATTVARTVQPTSFPSSTSESLTDSSAITSSSPTPAPNHTGAIAGGVVGGVLGLALCGLIFFLFQRRKRREAKNNYNPAGTEDAGFIAGERSAYHENKPGADGWQKPELDSDAQRQIAELAARRPTQELHGVPRTQAELPASERAAELD